MMDKLTSVGARVGRYFIAGAMVAFGIQHFLWAQYVRTLVPAWVGNAGLWTYFGGLILIAAGIGICWDRTARLAGTFLGVAIFLWVWMLHVPRALGTQEVRVEWTSVFQALAFSGGAFLLASALPSPMPRALEVVREAGNGAGRHFIALAMAFFGVEHFYFAGFYTGLVPGWLAYPALWVKVGGVALLAASAGILWDGSVRLAATLLGAMLLSWAILVHGPRALGDNVFGGEWTNFFKALMFSGSAFLLANSPVGGRRDHAV